MTYLEPHPPTIPAPQPTSLSTPFWNGCAQGHLLFQRCTGCSRAAFPPSVACRWCLSKSLAWERSHGSGSVYSYSTVWRPQTSEFAAPYVAAIIDVDEGYQMLANVVGCSVEDIHVGMRVDVEFHSIGDGSIFLPYFRSVEFGTRS